jgi:hypothetical protein
MGKVQVLISFTLIVMLSGLISCGTSKDALPTAGLDTPALSQSLQQALSELDILPTPQGADAANFAGLKAALRKMLIARGSSKLASAAPGSARSKVTDLAVAQDGASARFHWSYRNEGDYNQDSAVNVQDLTPLGIHWAKDSTAPDWAVARVADGNENGKVELGDLVSIGANYLYRVTRYSLQYSAKNVFGSVWTEVASIPFASSMVPAGQLRQFDFPLATALNGYYRVTPYDSTQAGIPGAVDPAGPRQLGRVWP